MLFKTKLLAGCVAGLLVSSVALADSSVEFKGYARAGFTLNLSKMGRTFAVQGAGQSQGEQGLSTRHVRNLDYLQLWVTKNFENNSKFVFSIDNEIFQEKYKGYSRQENETFSGFAVRDAYYQTEVTPDVAIWAGQRQFIFDDIRVLDILNEYDAVGAGVVVAKNTDVFISKAKTTKLTPVNIDPNTLAKDNDLQFVAHSKIDLGTLSISPEVAVVRSADVMAGGEKALGGKTAFTGRVLVGVANNNMWNNTGLRFSQSPNYACITNEEGNSECDKLKKTEIELTESGSFEFGPVGLLVGAFVKYEKYSDKVPFNNKKGELKEGKNRVIASVDVQPVFYATNNFHLALDINKTIKTRYADVINGDFDPSAALLITPIARYALAKNTIGQAQVYTSVTYGKYERKVNDEKIVWNGKKLTDNIVTMQTGFELAF